MTRLQDASFVGSPQHERLSEELDLHFTLGLRQRIRQLHVHQRTLERILHRLDETDGLFQPVRRLEKLNAIWRRKDPSE